MILTKLKFKDKEHLNLRCLVQVGPYLYVTISLIALSLNTFKNLNSIIILSTCTYTNIILSLSIYIYCLFIQRETVNQKKRLPAAQVTNAVNKHSGIIYSLYYSSMKSVTQILRTDFIH